MAAECWWCEVGIPKVVPAMDNDPLGCCYDCRVFACGGHAELERYHGKWLCLQSVAQAAAAGAGIVDAPEGIVIESSDQLAERLPLTALATSDDRQFFKAGDGEGWLFQQPERLSERGFQVTDPWLLGDALGIGRFIEGGMREWEAHFIQPMEPPRPVLPGLLGQLLAEAPR